MTVVAAESTHLPWTRPMTAEEFAGLDAPDDGTRVELIDGVLVVSPSPTFSHQWDSGQVFAALFAACPPDIRVVAAPLDVRLSDDTVVQPDILAVRLADVADDRVTGVPLLAVEFLSPSTRGHDLLLKRARYERAGIGSYWVVDPPTGEAVVWELDGRGRYREAVTGTLYDADLRVERPFPVTLRLTR
ncbi:MAG: Uma2 family endonuclease [Kineosporiaceae bacterium]